MKKVACKFVEGLETKECNRRQGRPKSLQLRNYSSFRVIFVIFGHFSEKAALESYSNLFLRRKLRKSILKYINRPIHMFFVQKIYSVYLREGARKEPYRDKFDKLGFNSLKKV